MEVVRYPPTAPPTTTAALDLTRSAQTVNFFSFVKTHGVDLGSAVEDLTGSFVLALPSVCDLIEDQKRPTTLLTRCHLRLSYNIEWRCSMGNNYPCYSACNQLLSFVFTYVLCWGAIIHCYIESIVFGRTSKWLAL